jgi:tRNA-specific 2-thiouridylase
MVKPQIREIAERAGLVTAKKKDSTGICFIGERKFREFLSKYLPAQKGKIIDLNGKQVGEHYGLMYYTLGQRKGLGVGGIAGEEQNRWYVVEKRLKDNTLIVSCGEGEELLTSACSCSGLNIIGKWDKTEFECAAKFRYRQDEQPVKVKFDGDKAEVEFLCPQRAVTPGQYAVFYYEDRCLGGAVIDSTRK